MILDSTLKQPLIQDPSYPTRIHLFQRKQEMLIAERRYTVETLWRKQDLEELIELRKHSFFDEFDSELVANIDLFDDYDMAADHVVVRSRDTKEIVASYRILNSDFTRKFYSAEQFDIQSLQGLEGTKLELSRAVVHKEHRNGIVLAMMWKGLAGYAVRSGADYFFGCSSVKSTSPKMAYSMYKYLEAAKAPESLFVGIYDDYQFDEALDADDLLPDEVIKPMIPSLLRAYIKAGSKIVSEPALDKKFKCFDFLTMLDIKSLDPQYRKKFFGC